MTTATGISNGLTTSRFEKLVLFSAVAVLAGIKLLAHFRFGTSFDSALLGNVAWRLGNGLDSVSTLTGFQYFATHASLVIFPMALVFKLWPGAGVPVAYLWQTASVGLTGLGVLKAASAFGLSSPARRLLLLLTMLSPGAFLATRLDVHEPTLGLGFLAMTLGAGLGAAPLKRMWWWPVLAAGCRIEMAAATVVAGLLLASKPGSRRSGVFTTFMGLAGLSFSIWFVLRAGTEAASVAAHFSHLGSTPTEVIGNALTDPIALLRPLTEPVMLSSIVLWLLPLGVVVPLIGWRYLLVALPMAGVAILGVWAPADQYPHHYWYGFLVAAPVAAAAALSHKPERLRLLTLTGVVGIAIGWAGLVAAAPVLRPFGQPDPGPMRQMVAYMSGHDSASVSVESNVLPHLVARIGLYDFPRPFLCSEESIGPFAWSGEPPEFVLIPASRRQEVESHPVLGPILSENYRPEAESDLMVAYRLTAGGLTGLRCAGA